MSKCANCKNLEIYPAWDGSSRYVCFDRDYNKNKKAFPLGGNLCKDGFPQVKECDAYRPKL